MADAQQIVPAYINTPHGRLHYREAGAGRRAILLFHETPLSSKTFVPTMPLLAPHLRVIARQKPPYKNMWSC